MYQLTRHDNIIRKADGAFIPFDNGNSDFLLYQSWLSAGNTPDEAPPLPLTYRQFTVREFLALFTQEEKLGIKAATRGSDVVGLWYDEMLAAQYITAEDEDTMNGLAVMVEFGLLTFERKEEILAAMQPT